MDIPKNKSVDSPPRQPKKYLILSLDGGGVRGIIQPVILNRLEQELKEFSFISKFDMYAGTSAGSFNALACAQGVPLEALLSMWEKNISQVFTESWTEQVESLNNLCGAQYTTTLLKQILSAKFKGTLGDLEKSVVVPTFCLNPSALNSSLQNNQKEKNKNDQNNENKNDQNNNENKNDQNNNENKNDQNNNENKNDQKNNYQNNNENKNDQNNNEKNDENTNNHENKKDEIFPANICKQNINDLQANKTWGPVTMHNMNNSVFNDVSLIDVALRSSAAPTYFPIYQGFIDGGVYANNPTMIAIIQALRDGIALQDIYVLSISTGHVSELISSSQIGAGNWGLVEWAPWLLPLWLSSSDENQTCQAETLLGNRLLRIDPVLPRQIPLNDASAIPDLVNFAQNLDLTETKKWLSAAFDLPDDLNDSSTFVKMEHSIKNHVNSSSEADPKLATSPSSCIIV